MHSAMRLMSSSQSNEVSAVAFESLICDSMLYPRQDGSSIHNIYPNFRHGSVLLGKCLLLLLLLRRETFFFDENRTFLFIKPFICKNIKKLL